MIRIIEDTAEANKCLGKAFRRQCIESKAKTMKFVNKQPSCRIALSNGRK